MERPPPSPPPFPFPNNNNSSFSHFPALFDPPNSLLDYNHYSSSSYNNNLSPPPPSPVTPQQMAYGHQSFADAAHHPTGWPRINDPSAATAVSFHPPTYHYPHYSAVSDNCQNTTRSSSSVPTTLQLLPPSDHDHHHHHQNIHHHQGIKPSDTSTIFSHYKKLKFVFKKELKSSDVSPLGRIVIPKKDAEKNLPPLISREGINLVVRDLYSDRQWNLKYKFWSNNKSRMYVLENTEDFMKKNRLKKGDLIIFYLDEESYNYLFWIKRVEEEEEEEDVGLDDIVENVRQEEEEEDNNLLSMGIQAAGGPYNNTYTAASSSTSSYHQPGNGITNFFPFL